MIGHTGLAGIYDKRNDKQLAKDYMKFVHNVSVFERVADERIDEINDQVSELEMEKQNQAEINRDLKMQILELRQTILELRNGHPTTG